MNSQEKTKNLFIDTNILLSLYTLSNDDLVQFGKLKDRIGEEITLFVPHQVVNELKRNRENKLIEGMQNFKLNKPIYPVFCKGYEEYTQISGEFNNLCKSFTLWQNKIKDDIANESLPADTVIKELLAKATIIECDKYVDKAFHRYRIGNPPGKSNSYGDAINWECLLECIPDGEDLYFISNDKDYKSLFDKNKFHPFLIDEWHQKKKSEIFYFPSLVSFLGKHIQDIKLKNEEEKQALTDMLSACTNDVEMFGIISKLKSYDSWNEDQIEKLCEIAENNQLVSDNLECTDLFNFYSDLLSKMKKGSNQKSASGRIDQKLVMIDEYIEQLIREDEMRRWAEYEMMDSLEDYYNH